MKYSDTSIEKKVEAALKLMRVKYWKQYEIIGLLKVDFYLPARKLIIEADGCYHHGCPLHHPRLYGKKAATDHMRTQVMINRGYKVLRLWEHDINAMTTAQLSKRIKSVL